MSTIVCQNITTTLKLKFAPPSPQPQFGNWESSYEKQSTNHIYRHPSDKKSSFSLELCTETLGSESGSDLIINNSDYTSIFSNNNYYIPSNTIQKSQSPSPSPVSNSNSENRTSIQKMKSPSPKFESKNFPPPMSSISTLQVHRHTEEGGRLVMKAVEAPFRNSYLQAERCDGRLKLCFLTQQKKQQEPEPEPETEQEDDVDIDIEDIEDIDIDNEFEDMNELEKEEVINNKDHMGIEKYHNQNQRSIRCNGINLELLHSSWKPSLWVAIS